MEILKFRAWYEGDIEKGKPLLFEQYLEADSSIYFYNKEYDITYEFYVPFVDSSWIVQQYIGLKDIIGKEIYDGDILETSNSDDPCYELVEWGTQEWHPNYIPLSDCRVVGNIYQNAILLLSHKKLYKEKD